nr:unnamed protein product [Digitaria exilis]
MENVLLDRSSGSLEFPKRSFGRSRRRPAAAPGGGAYGSFPTCQPYNHLLPINGGAWTSAPPTLPYARPPAIYSSPSLPLLPSNQPPLLPLPPTATKYATFPCLPLAPPPPPPSPATRTAAGKGATVPAVPAPRQREQRRRRPSRPPPPSTTTEAPKEEQKKKPLERATPLPPAMVVTAALDDLEQELARNFVQDLLHALAPPPSSLPLPRFSLVSKGSSPAMAVAPAGPSCNVEAAAADGICGLLRL